MIVIYEFMDQAHFVRETALNKVHCDAIRLEYFLILCCLSSLLTLVVCSRIVQHKSFKNSTSTAIPIRYPNLDVIYLALISLNFIFIFKLTIPLD